MTCFIHNHRGLYLGVTGGWWFELKPVLNLLQTRVEYSVWPYMYAILCLGVKCALSLPFVKLNKCLSVICSVKMRRDDLGLLMDRPLWPKKGRSRCWPAHQEKNNLLVKENMTNLGLVVTVEAGAQFFRRVANRPPVRSALTSSTVATSPVSPPGWNIDSLMSQVGGTASQVQPFLSQLKP